MLADDYLFLPAIVNEIYSVSNATIRACDPEGLVFFDTIRSVWTPDNVLEVVGRYADAISYQPDDKYFNLTEFERVHAVSGNKPMVIADIGFGWPHPGYNSTEWAMYANQEAAASAYTGYLNGAVDSGFVAALNKCQYIDRFLDQPTATLKPGMLDFNGTAHQPYTNLVRDANLRVVAAQKWARGKGVAGKPFQQNVAGSGTSKAEGRAMIYEQPSGPLHAPARVFANPSPWPLPSLLNKTASVVWQRGTLAANPCGQVHMHRRSSNGLALQLRRTSKCVLLATIQKVPHIRSSSSRAMVRGVQS